MKKYFIGLILLLLALLFVGSGIYIFKDKTPETSSGLLSKKAFTNTKYGVTMYPPDGWYSKQDDYFNAQIMFLDQAQSTISDFASSNAIITLAVYPNNKLLFSSEKYIAEIKAEMEHTMQLYKSAGWSESANPEVSQLNHKYSLFNDAISSKDAIVVDGINGIAYDFGSYFNGTGIGRTILLEKDNKLFVIIAEVKDENTWIKDKEKIIQSMMSFRLIN